jgi:SulP family sulfate permease
MDPAGAEASEPTSAFYTSGGAGGGRMNIRAGAKSPLSGIMHSIFLLAFMLAGARLAAFVPLCALAGVLVVVCWNMAEKKEFAALLRDWRSATVLLATFGLTLAENLTVGIVAGCVLATVLAAVVGHAIPNEDM